MKASARSHKQTDSWSGFAVFSHEKEVSMNIDRLVLAFAGGFVLLSLLLSLVHSSYWLWFTAFVGANLLQASFTGFCPLAKVLKALGFKPGEAFK
jgi:hypothetical protein